MSRFIFVLLFFVMIAALLALDRRLIRLKRKRQVDADIREIERWRSYLGPRERETYHRPAPRRGGRL